VAVRDGAEALLAELPPGRALRIRPLPPVPIWNHWGVASLLFVESLMGGSWIAMRDVALHPGNDEWRLLYDNGDHLQDYHSQAHKQTCQIPSISPAS